MATFPFLPMAVLTVGLLSAWIVQLGMVTYAGYMVRHLGIVENKDQAGYFAGLLSFSFMAGRVTSAYFWGVTADRCGRRPVVLFSLASTGVLAVAFGFSATFLWALTCRFLLGLLNGMTVIFPILVSEICGKEHEVVGLGAVTSTWAFGALLGSGVCGILAEPADRYPSIFTESGVFGRFPYLLPNLVGAGLALCSIPLVFLFLPETLPVPEAAGVKFTSLIVPPIEQDEKSGSRSATGEEGSNGGGGRTLSKTGTEVSRGRHSLLEEGQGEAAASSSTWTAVKLFERGSLLAAGHVRVLLVVYGIYTFAISGFAELFALWTLSTTSAGGLDWSAEQIGQVLLDSGLMVFVFELFAVPLVTKRLGVTTSQRLSSVTLVFVHSLVPELGRLLNTGHLLMIASVGILFTIYSSCDAFYTCISFAINNAAEPERCGELNGLAACVASVASAVAPAAWSALYAFSVDVAHGGSSFPFPIDFRLAFWLIAFLRLIVASLSWSTINGDKFHRKRVDTPPETAED